MVAVPSSAYKSLLLLVALLRHSLIVNQDSNKTVHVTDSEITYDYIQDDSSSCQLSLGPSWAIAILQNGGCVSSREHARVSTGYAV